MEATNATVSLPEPTADGEHILHWKRANSTLCKRVVLFLHGFKGDKQETWKGPNGHFLYSLVLADKSLVDYEVMSFGYRTGFGLKMPPIATLSKQLLNKLQTLSQDYEQIVICAHSMGGIIAMQAVVDGLTLSQSTKLSAMILYGTPLEGSGLVNLTQIVLKLGSIKTALLVPIHFFLSRKGSQFNDLRKGSELLFRLRSAWARHVVNGGDTKLPAVQRADIAMRVVSGTDDGIVSEMSAKSFFGECDWCPIDFDHTGLVKPKDNSSDSFVTLRQFLTLARSSAALRTRRRLREIADSVLDYRTSKTILDWRYEVEFSGKNVAQDGSVSLFDDPIFATTRVKVCRYECVLSRPQIDIVFAFGSTAEASAWEGDPAYVHSIFVDSVRQDEKVRISESLTKAFDRIVPGTDARDLVVFRNLSVRVQKKGTSDILPLDEMKISKFAQAAVYTLSSAQLPDSIVGSDVILHLSFDTVRPVSVPSFSLEFPWLTSGVVATLDVASVEDLAVNDHVLLSDDFQVTRENLGNVRRVRVESEDLVLPGSLVRVGWQQAA